jgi:hypothetical protein
MSIRLWVCALFRTVLHFVCDSFGMVSAEKAAYLMLQNEADSSESASGFFGGRPPT